MSTLNVNLNGHKDGNFSNYYVFNLVETRLSLMDFGVFVGVHSLLDLGCNDGTLTMELHKVLRNKGRTVGVDLDEALISRGRLKYPQLELITADFLSHDFSELNNTRFDLVCGFGLTMWIHLNKGDEGLTKCLRFMARKSSKYLVLEPQTWKNYKSAKKRVSRLGMDGSALFNWSSMQIRGEDIQIHIDKILLDPENPDSFTSKQVFGKTKWQRQISVYIKQA